MLRVAASGWRTNRGELQTGQRAPRSGASARQSRQKLMARSSWRLALPTTADKRGATPIDVGRIEAVFGRKGRNQALVGGHIFKDPGEKSRLAGGRANLAGANARYGEKAAEPFAIIRDESKSLNRKAFCLFSCQRRVLFHRVDLSFRNWKTARYNSAGLRCQTWTILHTDDQQNLAACQTSDHQLNQRFGGHVPAGPERGAGHRVVRGAAAPGLHRPHRIALPAAIVAVLGSAYLGYVMVFRIGVLCVNCISVAAVNLLVLRQLWH